MRHIESLFLTSNIDRRTEQRLTGIPRKIALHGYYGNGNMGDEAILYATKAIFDRISNVELHVISHVIPFLTTNFGRRIAKLPYGRTILYKYHTRKMLKKVDEADALILGGGGLLCDRKTRDVSNDVRLIKHMQSKNKPTMIYGVGVSWLWREKSKQLIKEVVENANYVSCREPVSAKKIEDLGVSTPIHVTGDPAIKIPEIVGINSKPRKLDIEKINVCIALRGGFVDKTLANSLLKLIEFLIKRYNTNIKFIPMRTGWYSDDRIAHELIAHEIFRRGLNKPKISFFNEKPSVKEFVTELTETTLLIGAPLHSIILATSMGVPCIALSYKPDVYNYMEYVQSNHLSLSLKEASNEGVLIEKIEELFDLYDSISKRLLQNIAKIKQKILLDEKAINGLARGENLGRN